MGQPHAVQKETFEQCRAEAPRVQEIVTYNQLAQDLDDQGLGSFREAIEDYVSKFATEAMMQIVSAETENMGGPRVNCINPRPDREPDDGVDRGRRQPRRSVRRA